MADIYGFQNMDLDGLDFDDVNLLDSLSSPPPSDNLLFGPLPPLLPHEQQQQQPQAQLGGGGGAAAVVESSLTHTAAPLPPYNPDVELAEAVAGDWLAQINTPTAAPDTLASITAPNLPLGPTPDVTAPSLIRPPTLSPALEEWFARGLSTSVGAPPSRSAVVVSSQHENMNIPQGMDVDKGQETNNEMTLTKNMAAHHASPPIISQQYRPFHPPSIQERSPLTAETGVGITGAGTLNQAQLLSTRQPLTGWNPRWSRYVKSPPRNAHDLLSAPISLPYDAPAIHRPQQLHPLMPQGSHAPSTQHIFDLLNSTQPPYPSFSRTESSSIYQSPAAPVLPNASAHQPAVPRLLPPEPAAVPIRPSILSPNYHAQPVGCSSAMTTFISFGAGPAVPQRYPDIRDYQRNFLQSQQMTSHGGIAHHQAPALTPLPPSPLVSDNSNEHSQPWSRPSVQGSSPFHGPPILPKIPVSNIQSTISQPISIAPDESNPSTSPPGSNTPELSTPWIPNSYGNQLQSVVPASTDMCTANVNSESFVIPSSLPRPQATNRVRRILNLGTTPPPPPPKSSRTKAASASGKKAGTNDAEQLQIPDLRDPVEGWIKDLEWAMNKNWNRPQSTKKKAASRSACGRREKEESSASKRRKSNAAEKEGGKEEARPIPDKAQKTHEYQVNVVQPLSASEFPKRREVDNTAYDMHCPNVGVPMDPHIRFYIAAVRRNGG